MQPYLIMEADCGREPCWRYKPPVAEDDWVNWGLDDTKDSVVDGRLHRKAGAVCSRDTGCVLAPERDAGQRTDETEVQSRPR